MAYPQNWDEIADQCRDHLEACSGRPLFENAFAGAMENLDLLRQEFDFELLHPHISLAELVLEPVQNRHYLRIYHEKPSILSRVKLYNREALIDEVTVTQEQLVSRVYAYLEKPKLP